MRFAQLCEAALYALFAYWAHGRGLSITLSAALVPALFLASRIAIVGVMFALAWAFGMRRAPPERVGLPGGIAMVLREYAAFVTLNLLRTPWENQALRRDPPDEAPGEIAIVLVHGYFANRGCWAPMVPRLEEAGVGPVYAPSCRSHGASIEDFEEDLHRAIERVSQGRRVAIVAHSMGGLAARLYLARRGGDRVAKLITIGSPHHGTRLAPWGVGENAREMAPGSRFLASLEAAEENAAMPPALSIYSVHDNMILPQDSSRLAWARNAAVKGLGHISEFADAGIARLVIEELRRR